MCSAVCKIVFKEDPEDESPEELGFVTVIDPYDCRESHIVGGVTSSDIENTYVTVAITC